MFFERETRKILNNEVLEFNKFEEIFTDIFKKYQSDLYFPDLIEEEPFYILIKNAENPKEKDKMNCDDIFMNYLKEFYSQTNYDYFHFMFKFVLMFRQCINKLKNNSENKIIDPKNYFTQNNNAEIVPDMCNDFITDFMEPKDYYGLDTMELIELIQHLCHWLFSKNYTTSRLTLV